MKTSFFLPSHCCLTPPSWGTPCDINAIYTSLKSTFSGLQFHLWQYRSIFICLAVIASEIRETLRNSKRIWPYSSSRSSKVIDLGVNWKPICDFLLVINCNISRICYRFRNIPRRPYNLYCVGGDIKPCSINFEIFTFKDTKLLILPTHPCLMPPIGGTP